MPVPPIDIKYALVEDLSLNEGSISPPDGKRVFYSSARLDKERNVLVISITGVSVELRRESAKRPWLWQSSDGRYVYRKPCREVVRRDGGVEIKALEIIHEPA